jgi:hypothetical protein
MRSLDKELKRYWSEKLESPPPYPFQGERGLPVPAETEPPRSISWLQNCAGIAAILGLLSVLGSLWGDPGFSPTQGSLDIEGLQNALPLLREFLLTMI